MLTILVFITTLFNWTLALRIQKLRETHLLCTDGTLSCNLDTTCSSDKRCELYGVLVPDDGEAIGKTTAKYFKQALRKQGDDLRRINYFFCMAPTSQVCTSCMMHASRTNSCD